MTHTGPVHPGEILDEDFLKPLGLSRSALAIAVGVPAQRINEIANGRRAITADTALRLGRYFGSTPEFRLNLQTHYDLRVARPGLEEEVERIRPRQLTPRAAMP